MIGVWFVGGVGDFVWFILLGLIGLAILIDVIERKRHITPELVYQQSTMKKPKGNLSSDILVAVCIIGIIVFLFIVLSMSMPIWD